MSDFCAVALLVIAVFAGYLSAKWANNWSYWSHRICAASVIGLGWMALAHREQTPTDDRIVTGRKDATFIVASDIAKEAFQIMKEARYEQD